MSNKPKLAAVVMFFMVAVLLFAASARENEGENNMSGYQADERIYEEDQYTRSADGLYVDLSGQPISGLIKGHHLDMAFTGLVAKGRTFDFFPTFYPDGQLETEGAVFSGTQYVLIKRYSEEGRLVSETEYLNSSWDRIVHEYEEGLLVNEYRSKEGQLHGPYMSYSPADGRRMEGQYVNGRSHGPARIYYKSGQVAWEVNFVNGNKEGLGKSYDESGRLIKETNWVKGFRHGPERVYDGNGRLIEEINWAADFNNGEQNGLGKSYDQSGRLIKETSWVNGKKNGPEKTYDENGDLISEVNYLNDEPRP